MLFQIVRNPKKKKPTLFADIFSSSCCCFFVSRCFLREAKATDANTSEHLLCSRGLKTIHDLRPELNVLHGFERRRRKPSVQRIVVIFSALAIAMNCHSDLTGGWCVCMSIHADFQIKGTSAFIWSNYPTLKMANAPIFRNKNLMNCPEFCHFFALLCFHPLCAISLSVSEFHSLHKSIAESNWFISQ